MIAPIEPDDPGAEQPFISHLIELRDRLLRMMAAVALALLVTFPFANEIYTYVATPLMERLPQGATMIATQVISPFLAPFKLALVAAVLLAMPYLLYQIWSFVAPGLYRHEKRLALPLLVTSVILFYLGMVFAYYLVFPLIFGFMASTTPEGVSMMTDISAYLDFVLTLFFAFGIAFEVPVATILLVAAGVTTPEALAAKRPYVIVGVFVIGMLLTPPDVFSQTLLAVPMWMLFELGILFSRILIRHRAPRNAEGTETPSGPSNPPGGPPGGARARSSAPLGPKGPESGGSAAAQSASGVRDEVGRDIDGGVLEEGGRWHPLTEDEMEAELDLMDAEELTERSAPPPPASAPAVDRIEEKIRRANRLRELDNPFAARQALYEILEEGDETQRQVARNILRQLDDGDR